MYLDRIVAVKRREVEELRERLDPAGAERRIAELPPCRGFLRVLAEGRRREIGLIAEVKKASPSKGLIRDDFHPVELARGYEAAGADCLSVLTDREFFQGANEYLTRIRDAVGLPLLRKDFTIDPLQIYEARLIGADAILLIAAILKPDELASLHRLAKDLGMDALVEVHDRREMETVLELGIDELVGINNRDLRTFVTDLKTTEELAGLAPDHAILVSESGIASPDDIRRVREAGARAVLIGEHFMRQPDVGEAVLQLMGPVRR
ncbi:MAG: indole-3-glycerol phosphate synthase [Thermobacillus sp. ZCTH02-B1]|uniref:indole-3-glycerol phosphate synthase TrpC n=1 Tax=Thermobacillus sp. ZCTH02-B1 TaxID=1858795 RepID=UPI000B550BBD|nr:indole-3-glycerol phosphate synthase TrpC [Thermobacillus sp. ZCTH02-B1]OUM96777.1 MAG: indole-3-glycerol phosphate synthase [Thermobacillus sp. ZCTH02-B1]